jgi:hypothetical protein
MKSIEDRNIITNLRSWNIPTFREAILKRYVLEMRIVV